MGTFFLALWWIIVLAVAGFLGFGIAYMFSSPLTKNALRISNAFYTTCTVVGFVFLAASIALLILGLTGMGMTWLRIGGVALVAGILLGIANIIDDGRKIWKAEQEYDEKPLAIESLIKNSTDEDELENVIKVAAQQFSESSDARRSIVEMAEAKLIEVRSEIWGKRMEQLIVKAERKQDHSLITAINDGHYLPSKWENLCPHCDGQVRFELHGYEVHCICNGDCERTICTLQQNRESRAIAAHPVKQVSRTRPATSRPAVRQPSVGKASDPAAQYQRGDRIGEFFEVLGILGRGGCGVVYLVFSHETEGTYALKTMLDQHIGVPAVCERFRKEAQIWVDLEQHPYLVRAYFVDEISGRLFIAMEYVQPDQEGRNSIEGYLETGSVALDQNLRWGIQFCYGMEYAYTRGMRSHRDIKPANILISAEGRVKIADFGLAAVLGGVGNLPADSDGAGTQVRVGHTMVGDRMGTVTHMPPEQFIDATACDQRSDIYSFGVVLYQMANAGGVPFQAQWPEDGGLQQMHRFWDAMHELHRDAVPEPLETPLWPIIERCLCKRPDERYHSFAELRVELEDVMRREVGSVEGPPPETEHDTADINDKGASYFSLGQYQEAIDCFDHILATDPSSVSATGNKALCLYHLGRYEESLEMCIHTLRLQPDQQTALTTRARCLRAQSDVEGATEWFERALDINPSSTDALIGIGLCMTDLQRFPEAAEYFERAIAANDRCFEALTGLGQVRRQQKRFDEALQLIDRAVSLNPNNPQVLNSRALVLKDMGNTEEAIRCCDKAVELDPDYGNAWYTRAQCCHLVGRLEDVVNSLKEVLRIQPDDTHCWFPLARAYEDLERNHEAIDCFEQLLRIDPNNATAWCSMGIDQAQLGRDDDAAASFRRFLAVAPPDAEVDVRKARNWLREHGRL